jgi:hypothetical protein
MAFCQRICTLASQRCGAVVSRPVGDGRVSANLGAVQMPLCGLAGPSRADWHGTKLCSIHAGAPGSLKHFIASMIWNPINLKETVFQRFFNGFSREIKFPFSSRLPQSEPRSVHACKGLGDLGRLAITPNQLEFGSTLVAPSAQFQGARGGRSPARRHALVGASEALSCDRKSPHLERSKGCPAGSRRYSRGRERPNRRAVNHRRNPA